MITHRSRRARRTLPGRVIRLSQDDRGSIPILLMVVLVGLMLSSLLVPTIITQARTTRFDTTRVQALDAAQSGIDVALGAIRSSVTNSIGDSNKLPCGTMSGVVVGTSPAAYSVAVEYFTADPVNEPYPSTRAMKCVTGYGTFDFATGVGTPGFARFTSTGTVGVPINGSSAGRSLTATYQFRTSNVNILGGIVQVAGSALCIDVGSAGAPAGTVATLQPCSSSSPPAAQQVFSYRSDLTLLLTGSITSANPNGLCLDSSATPAVAGSSLVLHACGPLGLPAAYTQQWSYNDNGQYQAAQADSATTGKLPNLCVTVAAQAANQPLNLSSCGYSVGWVPSPSVGPGAAALPQWINYSEFGRCLDVTNQDPNHRFLIDYPCKQNPYPGAVRWNQLFRALPIPTGQASVTSTIVTTPGSSYCLTSPGLRNAYVTVRPCDASEAQNWTIYGGDKSLNYSAKYTIVNGSLCLGLSAPDPEVAYWSTIDVEPCTGTTDQKWNAVANVLAPTLKNVREN